MLVCASPVHAGTVANDEVSATEVLVMTLLRDIEDHVLYMQLAPRGESDLRDYLAHNLSMKLFDLAIHLGQTRNTEIRGMVCNTVQRLRADIVDLISGVETAHSDEVHREWRRLVSVCEAYP
jgi:hypothetical protein